MLKYIHNKLTATRDQTKISNSLVKGLVASSSRRLLRNDPISWEFSGFSQNGEDGVIDFLLSEITYKTKCLIEFGCGDGLENNSTWVAIVHKFHGFVVDEKEHLIRRHRLLIGPYSRALRSIESRVTPENVISLVGELVPKDIDLLSLDIDSYDFEVMHELLCAGFRPAIAVVEYNSAFGDVADVFIPFNDYERLRSSCNNEVKNLIYGVSYQSWIKLFESYDYQLVHADSSGVNMFFVSRRRFTEDFLNDLHPATFQKNVHQLQGLGLSHLEQKELLSDILARSNYKFQGE